MTSPLINSLASRCITVSIYISTRFVFFFNHTSTTEIYTLSLHDALPIFIYVNLKCWLVNDLTYYFCIFKNNRRSEEHTSELQSRGHLVCRLLLEKKNYNKK